MTTVRLMRSPVDPTPKLDSLAISCDLNAKVGADAVEGWRKCLLTYLQTGQK